MGSRVMPNGLTARQVKFCEEYITNGFNATHAAIAAGYSKKTAPSTGHENTKNPKLAEYIKARTQELLDDTTKMSLEWVQNVLKIARSDIRKIAKWDENGVELKSSEEIDEATAYAIQEVTETEGQYKRKSVKLESKTAALTLLGKYLGIANESTSIDTPDEKIDREERKRRINNLVSRV